MLVDSPSCAGSWQAFDFEKSFWLGVEEVDVLQKAVLASAKFYKLATRIPRSELGNSAR
jgi:hypothetical protein